MLNRRSSVLDNVGALTAPSSTPPKDGFHLHRTSRSNSTATGSPIIAPPSADKFEGSPITLKNDLISELSVDVLYHIGFTTELDLPAMFGDVKPSDGELRKEIVCRAEHCSSDRNRPRKHLPNGQVQSVQSRTRHFSQCK
eukprot:Opistho-2@13851